MKLPYVLVLLAVSVMPSSAGQSLKRPTLEQYYDAHARYRPTRHHHGHRYYSRHYRSINNTKLRRPSLPTPEVAAASMEPFDWKIQSPVRWADVDVSTVLKPMEFVVFPIDPAPFRLPADPPIVKQYYFHDVFPKWSYTFALLIMLSTCHKSCANALTRVTRKPKWMPSSVWRDREVLRNLT